jgi:hypothetical protein
MLKFKGVAAIILLVSQASSGKALEDCNKFGAAGQLEDRLKCLQKNSEETHKEMLSLQKADSGAEATYNETSGEARFHIQFTAKPVVIVNPICQRMPENVHIPPEDFDCRASVSIITTSGFSYSFVDAIGGKSAGAGYHWRRGIEWIAVAR